MSSTPGLDSTSSVYIPYLAASSRAAGVNVAYAATYLILGIGLAFLGRRAWRLTCAIALGLAVQLVTSAVTFNVMGVGGFNSSFSDTNNDLALYGLVTGLGLAGVLFSVFLPKKWYAGWWLGWLFLGPLAGMSVAFTMMILKNGEGMLVDSLTGRWILIGVFAIIGLVSVVATKWRGATLASSLIGMWLLALGIDLLVNANRGASLGMRKLLDENDIHAEALRSYDPPLSTKLLFGLSWLFALLFALLQEFLYSDRHFLQIQPSQQGRHWKLWFFPFLLRSSSLRATNRTREVDLEKPGQIGLSESGDGESTVLHSRQNSVPSSVTDIDQDLAERGSLASGSDLRALTRNYRRALEILESDDEQSTEQTRETSAIPIYYRPSPVNLMASATSPSPDVPSPVTPGTATRQQDRQPLLAAAIRNNALATGHAVQRSADRPPLAPIQMEYTPRPRHRSEDQIPDLGAIGRAESDRGTTYSIPLTNITASEYKDRENIRPPSWQGDLPWHPSMLRGPLDPATLPRHPPEEEILQEGATGSVIIRPADMPIHAIPITGHGATIAAVRSRSPNAGEDDFEIVNAADVSPNRQANVRISGPFQLPYPSRPGSRDGNGSPNALASLGGTGRTIPKVQRTPTRDHNMFPAEDDLPDHSYQSPEGHAGHSRFHTSDTAVEPLDSGHLFRDEDPTAYEQAEDMASSHASYSMHNFKSKRIPVPHPNRRQSKQKSMPDPYTPLTESSDSTGQLTDRPITQSDLTPQLQDRPFPPRPVLVHNNSPALSNQASLTGTPRSSTLGMFGRASANVAHLGSKSELSEITARPSQEQRTLMNLETPPEHQGHASQQAVQEQGNQRKVRFVGTGTSSSGGRRTLRERLLRR